MMPAPNEIPLSDEVLRRKLVLKKQAVSVLQGEVLDLEEMIFFRSALQRRERRIGDIFDRRLSQEIDALHLLLEH